VKVDLVGISMSSLDLLAPVARRVAAIKKASCNPRLAVMVGGSTLVATEVASIGAIFCNDPRDAVRWLEQHVRVGVALGGS
jgi:methanogenic corrinoid protein MtbC1